MSIYIYIYYTHVNHISKLHTYACKHRTSLAAGLGGCKSPSYVPCNIHLTMRDWCYQWQKCNIPKCEPHCFLTRNQGTFAGSEVLISGNVTRRIAMLHLEPGEKRGLSSSSRIDVRHWCETSTKVKKTIQKLTLISKGYLKHQTKIIKIMIYDDSLHSANGVVWQNCTGLTGRNLLQRWKCLEHGSVFLKPSTPHRHLPQIPEICITISVFS